MAKSKKKATKAKFPAFVECFNKDGCQYYAIGRAAQNVRNSIDGFLSNTIGSYQLRQMGGIYPTHLIFKHWEGIAEEANQYGFNDSQDWIFFSELVSRDQIAFSDDVAAKVAVGKIEFDDLPHVFLKDQEVIVKVEGEPLGGIVESIILTKTMFSTYCTVKIKVIHTLNGAPSEALHTSIIGGWSGLLELSALPIVFATEEQKAALTARGLKWLALTNGDAYVSYEGDLVRSSYWSAKTYRANGRVMIDSKSFKQIESDQFQSEIHASGINAEPRDEYDDVEPQSGDTSSDISSEVWRSFPYVYGFSFSAKQWGRLAVSRISPIKWRSNAFDSLVMEQALKTLVKALVEHQAGTFEDIIEGKGGGTIFLLAGPPGVGKTLTAETVAETLKRPLYTVSVGELGVNPDELEDRLRVILDVATIWNAVILLDEADIFLEARDEKDILRNAMVGVFLRLLEYHQGVMFLTTNRVNNLDPAFLSRISIGIEYPSVTDAVRERIWNNLLVAAGYDVADGTFDLAYLRSVELNGRQIKNVIRLSQTLANSRGTAVDMYIITEVMNVTGRFKPNFTHCLSNYGQIANDSLSSSDTLFA